MGEKEKGTLTGDWQQRSKEIDLEREGQRHFLLTDSHRVVGSVLREKCDS